MKKLTFTLLIAFGSASLYAAYPTGYYDSLVGKAGAELKEAAKNLVRDHTVISYGDDTWAAFESTDVRLNSAGERIWWDMYSDNEVLVSSGHSGLNIEHSVANSWWGKTKNDAYKDLFHLNPSNAEANNRKSNYPLGHVATVTYTNGVTFVGKPESGDCGGANYVYEPIDTYKGDFARAFMYIFTTYDDIAWQADATDRNYMFDGSAYPSFREWAYQLLLDWAALDPVSQKEIDRNEAIYAIQGNRNPYIDLPDLAEYVWGDKAGQPYKFADTEDPTDPDDPEDPTEADTLYKFLAEDDDAGADGWTLDYDATFADGLSKVWSWRTLSSGSHYLNGSAYVSGTPYASVAYAVSPEINLFYLTEAAVTFEHAARYQTNLRTDCKFVVRQVGAPEWTTLEIPEWPESGAWTWASCGTIDLSAYVGKKIQVAFKYVSTDTCADTWEVRNLAVTGKLSTGVEALADDPNAPSEVYNLSGMRVGSTIDGLQPGIYVVRRNGSTHKIWIR